MLARLAVLLSLTLLAGCGSDRVRLNHGADLAVYEATPAWFHEHMPRKYGTRFLGLYDPTDGSITIDESLSPLGKVRVLAHEMLGHAWDHQKPQDGWELMARYHSESFTLLTHSESDIALGRSMLAQFPDQLDVKRATDAARDAASQSTSPSDISKE